ncbi:E3 ubiquitin-protein ligase complex slx8-rfp subunit slx8 [Colletotrichum spaethianum]|uniref:E3 ubiquitin-protein ligase complex slx8-rfp subunit slx8 n=1 Tax=Colletotrichum spaethianum TaxID=700344 RepID=A0AA37PGV0_9PEZI|nr:E3 ubiquitin-protein ligase complex slx8-rfp subunit slx8 [Colletotrichum spaethianum]GKT52071.1 E3 ubiquitin-protein ligase complex slx8-rfp subunit slx8 [Colletotrichum spaethianum]
MPGLIPFLPTPPLPQPTRTSASSAPGRPVNSLPGSDQVAARGNSSQTPIELDDDSEPTSASGPRNATHTHQHQHQHHIENLWGSFTPDSTQYQQALPSFSDFAANLDSHPFDATALLQNGAPQTPNHEPISDEYLSALADGNFSSPSSYPRFTQASTVTQQTNLAQSQDAPHRHASGTTLRPNRPARYASQDTNAAATAAVREPTSHPVYHNNEVEESLFVSSDDEPEVTMPVQTRRRASTILSSDHDPEPEEMVAPATRKRAAPSSAPARGTAAPKRRRTSQPQAARNRTTTPSVLGPDDDIFGEDKVDTKKGKEKDEDVIDLADANEVPENLKVPKEDNRVKISAFQCVICMDDVTALTVTHCGHLFCSECLHSALNVDATKNKCPICRQKVETKDRNDYTAKTKGFWPLELKLMTASRKGKQRA